MPKAALRFPKRQRLNQRGVQAVLRDGRRLKNARFDITLLGVSAESAASVVSEARIAIAVAKHQLKKAVSRNRIKRLVRESFRQHPISTSARDLLVTYKARSDAHLAPVRRKLRSELVALFDLAIAAKQIRVRDGSKT